MHKQKAENILYTDSIYSTVTVNKNTRLQTMQMHFTGRIIIHLWMTFHNNDELNMVYILLLLTVDFI